MKRSGESDRPSDLERHKRQRDPDSLKRSEEEMHRRIEEAVATRVAEEMERRREAMETEVRRRVEEARHNMEKQLLQEMEQRKAQMVADQRVREVGHPPSLRRPQAPLSVVTTVCCRRCCWRCLCALPPSSHRQLSGLPQDRSCCARFPSPTVASCKVVVQCRRSHVLPCQQPVILSVSGLLAG